MERGKKNKPLLPSSPQSDSCVGDYQWTNAARCVSKCSDFAFCFFVLHLIRNYFELHFMLNRQQTLDTRAVCTVDCSCSELVHLNYMFICVGLLSFDSRSESKGKTVHMSQAFTFALYGLVHAPCCEWWNLIYMIAANLVCLVCLYLDACRTYFLENNTNKLRSFTMKYGHLLCKQAKREKIQ